MAGTGAAWVVRTGAGVELAVARGLVIFFAIEAAGGTVGVVYVSVTLIVTVPGA